MATGRRVRKKSIVKRIIESCRYVVKRGSDPFQIDVKEYIKLLRDFIASSSSVEELVLDLNAIEEISRVVELQGEWVKSRSTKLYLDPLLVEWKIRNLSLKQLASIIASAWYPIASIKVFTPRAIEEAVNYWLNLPPLRGRWDRLPKPVQEVTSSSIEELIEEKLALKGNFTEIVDQFYEKLIEYSKGKPVLYMDFVIDKDYQVTLLKAYLVSFLATYGYIDLEYDPKSKDYIIVPVKKESKEAVSKSIVVSISTDEWLRRVKSG